MLSRREVLRSLAVGGCGAAFAPLAHQMRAVAADSETTRPKRFVFVTRSNGILLPEIQPVGLEDLVKVRPKPGWNTKSHQASLADHDLPKSMAAVAPFKDRVTIFQGLSAKMCRGGHDAAFGALGCYASGTFKPPRKETIDGVLATKLRGVFPHLGFTMDDFGKSIAYPALSATGPNKVLPYYADPMLAYKDLFGSVIQGQAKADVDVQRNVLDFLADDVRRFQKGLNEPEKEKLDHYLQGFESIQARQRKLASMETSLKEVAPELRDIYESEVEIERLKAHFELATAALIGGLTQVVSIRAEHLGMRLYGLGLGAKTVHGIGHMIEGTNGGGDGAAFGDGKGEFDTRAVVLEFHMNLIGELATKLAAIPEGDGNMLDNTVIVYLSDHGDRHHSNYDYWPMVAIGNVGGKLKTGQYIHVPDYGSSGHRLTANLYLSLLHAAGFPQDNFGDPDLQLDSAIDQSGALAEWMT